MCAEKVSLLKSFYREASEQFANRKILEMMDGVKCTEVKSECPLIRQLENEREQQTMPSVR